MAREGIQVSQDESAQESSTDTFDDTSDAILYPDHIHALKADLSAPCSMDEVATLRTV